MTTAHQVLQDVLRSLNDLQIAYMVVGSFSSNHYGVPRSTHDADIVIAVQTGQLTQLIRALGPSFQLDQQLTFETATATKRQILKCRGQSFNVELFHLSDDAHDQERFRRRVLVHELEVEAWMPTAEDVVIWKLRWLLHAERAKDRDDITNVLGLQRQRLDWPYVHRWCDVHGTRALLDEILATITTDP